MCVKGGTQNSNESYHNVVWSITSKKHFVAKITLNIAVHLAAARYAVGFRKCLEAMTGRKATSRAITSFMATDQDRITHSIRRANEMQKGKGI